MKSKHTPLTDRNIKLKEIKVAYISFSKVEMCGCYAIIL